MLEARTASLEGGRQERERLLHSPHVIRTYRVIPWNAENVSNVIQSTPICSDLFH